VGGFVGLESTETHRTQTEPLLPFAHEALRYYNDRQRELAEVDAQMAQALGLGATGFAPLCFHGMLLVQDGRLDEKTAEQAKQSLESMPLSGWSSTQDGTRMG